MRFIHLRHLNGPNVFTASPAVVARLELDELTGRETTDFAGFAERLTALLPGLAGHHCAAGRPGGFLEALSRGTYFGHVTEHVALELSALAGREVHLGRTMWAGADGRYDVMMECPRDEPADSTVPADLLALAISLVQDVLDGHVPSFGAELSRISRSCLASIVSPTTRPDGTWDNSCGGATSGTSGTLATLCLRCARYMLTGVFEARDTPSSTMSARGSERGSRPSSHFTVNSIASMRWK